MTQPGAQPGGQPGEAIKKRKKDATRGCKQREELESVQTEREA